MTQTKGRNSSRPIGIDLFAGAGGMSLGFEQAGFDIAASIEIDPIHCAVHKFNFPECTVIPRSVEHLTGSHIRKLSGIGSRAVDCVFGGPPCQGFSLIGHRALDDPRNGLVIDFVRIAAELDARTFVFENVKGLTVGRHRAFLEELAIAFDRAGYECVPWKVLDAADFGVPQHRERLILMGVRKGTTLPKYPAPTVRPADAESDLSGLPVGPTCWDALGDLPDVDRFPELIESDVVDINLVNDLTDYAYRARCIDSTAWKYGYIRDWNPTKMTSCARTGHSDISRRRFSETTPGEVEPISRFFKLAPNGLSNTLRAGTDGARGAFTSPRPIHYKYARCVTVREMARLHGFPDWFRFHATKWHGARQIGNSVAPPLAYAIASEVMRAIKARPILPRRVVELGEPRLLYMEMSEAAAHFDVVPPNGRRDRKSGAKKRKQHEIEEQRQAALRAADD